MKTVSDFKLLLDYDDEVDLPATLLFQYTVDKDTRIKLITLGEEDGHQNIQKIENIINEILKEASE